MRSTQHWRPGAPGPDPLAGVDLAFLRGQHQTQLCGTKSFRLVWNVPSRWTVGIELSVRSAEDLLRVSSCTTLNTPTPASIVASVMKLASNFTPMPMRLAVDVLLYKGDARRAACQFHRAHRGHHSEVQGKPKSLPAGKGPKRTECGPGDQLAADRTSSNNSLCSAADAATT